MTVALAIRPHPVIIPEMIHLHIGLEIVPIDLPLEGVLAHGPFKALHVGLVKHAPELLLAHGQDLLALMSRNRIGLEDDQVEGDAAVQPEDERVDGLFPVVCLEVGDVGRADGVQNGHQVFAVETDYFLAFHFGVAELVGVEGFV